MKTHKPLVAKTSLKAKTALKGRLKPLKQPKPTITKLKKEADKWLSLAVRYRDGKRINGEWYSQCITSGDWIPLNKCQAGHFMSRRYTSTRYEEENVNAQCYRCNVMFYGEQYKYAKAIDLKYGDGTAEKLANLAKQSHRFTRPELEEIIDNAKKTCTFYENQIS